MHAVKVVAKEAADWPSPIQQIRSTRRRCCAALPRTRAISLRLTARARARRLLQQLCDPMERCSTTCPLLLIPRAKAQTTPGKLKLNCVNVKSVVAEAESVVRNQSGMIRRNLFLKIFWTSRTSGAGAQSGQSKSDGANR